MSVRTETIEARTESLLQPIVVQQQFELVDVEFVKEAGDWYLRAYIDKEGGITVDDCELVSRALEVELDREDFITESYILEVSSPGLDRPLKKEKDFARALGQTVEIRTYKPMDGEKQFTGQLLRYDADTVTLQIEEQQKQFAKADLALIRMAVEW